MPNNMGLFALKLYFYDEFIILKAATASLRDYQCQALYFKTSFIGMNS